MKEWSLVEKVLSGVLAVVVVGVAVLGFMAWRSDDGDDVPEGCEGATLDSDLESDDTPTDVLRRFVQSRPDDLPLDDSWTLVSDDDGVYRFVSDEDGRYEVDVRDGLVRRYLICPDG